MSDTHVIDVELFGHSLMYMLDLHFHACQKASVSQAFFLVADPL